MRYKPFLIFIYDCIKYFFFNLFDITADVSLYVTVNKDIGLQFSKLILGLFGLGMHVIIPCF